MNIITSCANPFVKKILLLHKAKHRMQEGLFIAEGLRTCATLLDAGMTCTHLLYTHETESQIASLPNVGTKTLVSPSVMDKISTTHTPSGILGIFKIPDTNSAPLTTPGLVLAQISDPGNMGTLIRTAAAMNVRTIIVVEGCDPWNPKVIQASAGTIGMVSLFSWSWQKLIEHKGRLPLYALVVDNGASIKNIDLKKGLLVVGNEANGIPATWLKDCDALVTLPMPGGTESLNAAIAGSIALYIGGTQTLD